jgi:hypothetical protein
MSGVLAFWSMHSCEPHAYHAYPKLAGLPAQVPVVALSIEPTFGVPPIVGGKTAHG